MMSAGDKPSVDRLIAKQLGLQTAFEPALLQCSNNVLAQLQRPQPQLEVHLQLEPTPYAMRQAKRFEPAQPPSGQRGPGIIHTDTIIDTAITVGSLYEAAVEGSEAVRLGLSPDPPLGVRTREVAEQFLGHLLSPGAKAEGHIVARDDQVPPGASSTSEEDVRRLGD